MTRMLTRSAILLVAVLVLGACTGSARKVDLAADLALAKSALVSATDLPGYAETPYTKSDDIPASVEKDFAKCLNVSVTILADTPGAKKANSPNFHKAQASVSSSVEIDPNKSDADKGWNANTKSGVERCLRQLIQGALKLAVPDATIGDTTVTKFDLGIGSRSVGYEAKDSVLSQGINVVIYSDRLLVARDRAQIELDTVNAGQPFNRATEIALARAMYNRIGAKAR